MERIYLFLSRKYSHLGKTERLRADPGSTAVLSTVSACSYITTVQIIQRPVTICDFKTVYETESRNKYNVYDIKNATQLHENLSQCFQML